IQQENFATLSEVLPVRKVACYLQIENKIKAVVKYETRDGSVAGAVRETVTSNPRCLSSCSRSLSPELTAILEKITVVTVHDPTADDLLHKDSRRASLWRDRRPLFRRVCGYAQGGGGRLRQAVADHGAALYHHLDHHESGNIEFGSGEDARPPIRGGSHWLVVF